MNESEFAQISVRPNAKIFSLMSFLFFVSSLAFAENIVTRDFIDAGETQEKIEFYWSKPDGNGPFPALLIRLDPTPLA